MRQMEEAFNEESCIRTLSVLSGHKGLEEMPHYDTLNYYLERLSPECLSDLRKKWSPLSCVGNNSTEGGFWELTGE